MKGLVHRQRLERQEETAGQVECVDGLRVNTLIGKRCINKWVCGWVGQTDGSLTLASGK